jgi:hypothetical protein
MAKFVNGGTGGDTAYGLSVRHARSEPARGEQADIVRDKWESSRW